MNGLHYTLAREQRKQMAQVILQMMGFNAKTELHIAKQTDFTEKATPDEAPEEGSVDSSKLTVEIPLRLVDEATLANLDQIIEGKGNLIRKAIGAESLAYEVTDSKVLFPWFTLSGNADEALAYTQLISKLVEQARIAKRVTMKEKKVENEKYAFRCFLLRLGFIGDEYKAARCKLRLNGTPVPLLRNGYSIFNGTKYR